MNLTFDLKSYNGTPLDTVATGSDGKRYFLEEDGTWKQNGSRAKEWNALYNTFRRSDWGGIHISGCSCNQYLAGSCSQNCRIMTKMLYDLYGGFDDRTLSRDEQNEYVSSAESYG